MAELSRSTRQNQFTKPRQGALAREIEPVSLPSAANKGMECEQVIPDSAPLPASKRLVIILPDMNFDLFTLPRRIWKMALQGHRPVLLIAKPANDENESSLRRDLATLAALIRDPRIEVNTLLVLGKPLQKAVEENIQPGDLIVCYAEHFTRQWFKKVRLAETLVKQMRLPVYTLSGSVDEIQKPFAVHLLDLLVFLVSVVTLIGFLALEVWINQNTSGAVLTVTQILAVIGEIWLLSAIAAPSLRR